MRSWAKELERAEVEVFFALEFALDEDDVAEVEERRLSGLGVRQRARVEPRGRRERSEHRCRFRSCDRGVWVRLPPARARGLGADGQ